MSISPRFISSFLCNHLPRVSKILETVTKPEDQDEPHRQGKMVLDEDHLFLAEMGHYAIVKKDPWSWGDPKDRVLLTADECLRLTAHCISDWTFSPGGSVPIIQRWGGGDGPWEMYARPKEGWFEDVFQVGGTGRVRVSVTRGEGDYFAWISVEKGVPEFITRSHPPLVGGVPLVHRQRLGLGILTKVSVAIP